LSYGGRTDGLFHRSIQESGSAATAWYNGSDWYQPIFDKIVDQVNCTEAIDTLECLRTVDYEVLYPFLNSSAIVGPGWYPTVGKPSHCVLRDPKVAFYSKWEDEDRNK
jgi:hypothetical protein